MPDSSDVSTQRGPTEPGRLPRTWTDDQLDDLLALTYDAGWHEGRVHAMACAAELDATWRPVGRRAYEDAVQERIAEMEQHAAAGYARLGKPAGWRYRGGPVDWATGLPARSACAWMHRHQAAPAVPQRRAA